MYVLKMDFPTGVVYFTGRKKIVQGSESPGLTSEISEARHFEDEEEAKKFCMMLIKKYDMEFYYSPTDGNLEEERRKETEQEAAFENTLSEEVEKAFDDNTGE